MNETPYNESSYNIFKYKKCQMLLNIVDMTSF
jgi:hypothetical protein